jgi:imidazole glycerol-phosphate synthase subunit HisH
MKPTVAIVDYGVGNLFSVAQACRHVGLDSAITSDVNIVAAAQAIILPGVGAFGFAMHQLDQMGMIPQLKAAAASGKPVMGVCLGFQLLFASSTEMGSAAGLGIFKGVVTPLREGIRASGFEGKVRMPNINWLPVQPTNTGRRNDTWSDGWMAGVPAGVPMYFVHSYFATPQDETLTIARTSYDGLEYCCAVERQNVFGCQFHPEKSGEAGLLIYRNLAGRLSVT